MLRKFLTLGASLAIALTAAGGAWATGYDSNKGHTEYYKHYKPSYPFCPAKSKWACDNKGGTYDAVKKTCSVITDTDVEYCGKFVAKKISYTLWYKDYYKCKKEDKADELCYFKKYGKLIPVDYKYCDKACDDDYKGHDGKDDYDHKKDDGKKDDYDHKKDDGGYGKY